MRVDLIIPGHGFGLARPPSDPPILCFSPQSLVVANFVMQLVSSRKRALRVTPRADERALEDARMRASPTLVVSLPKPRASVAARSEVTFPVAQGSPQSETPLLALGQAPSPS